MESGEPAKGSLAQKVNGCMWGVKAMCCPILQKSNTPNAQVDLCPPRNYPQWARARVLPREEMAPGCIMGTTWGYIHIHLCGCIFDMYHLPKNCCNLLIIIYLLETLAFVKMAQRWLEERKCAVLIWPTKSQDL